MITQISKLKNFGIFYDFSWNSKTIPNFTQFNLIYGWNKSGKTTLSRIFVACEKKTTNFKQYPKDDETKGEFKIKTNDNSIISHSNLQNGIGLVKVFNKDFIENNISFDPSNPSNPIVYISEEDIQSKKRLEQLKADKSILETTYNNSRIEAKAKEEIKNKFLIGLGREIANVLFDKTYNKIKAEQKINQIGVDNFSDKILSEEDKKKYEEISKSEKKEPQNLLKNYLISFSINEENITNPKELFDIVQKLLNKTVVSETIDRLKDDQALNSWVQQGFELHKEKTEKEKCLFCQKQLDVDFLDFLSKHFSKDYNILQKTIFNLKNEILKIKIDKDSMSLDGIENNLYPDLKNSFLEQRENLEKDIIIINSWLDTLISQLDKKYKSPLAVISNPEKSENNLDSYNQIIDELNIILAKHNDKIKNHQQEKERAGEKLELHSIAFALSQEDYKKLENDFKEAIAKQKEALRAVKKNDTNISELEKKTSNIGEAIQKINKHLESFFGRKEILLELDNLKKGYIIKRNGKTAHNLSEGEKTAVAFSYFIVKTEEKGSRIKESIIFIDDPISSFDSNFIYHCFSLIKNYFKGAEQLIVSTHNFEFFNLFKYWFKQKNEKVEIYNKKISNSKDKKLKPCNFFRIENTIENNKRCASIALLDKTLEKFRSEYHFLFSRLNQFMDTNMPDYADFYTIGNIARRFLEIYINFKIPTTGDLKSKVVQLNTSTVSNTEKDKVYKLIQEFSHGSDPVSAIEHKDKNEIQNAITILMKMVRESDERHFEFLKSDS